MQMPGLCLAKPLCKLLIGEQVGYEDVKDMDHELGSGVESVLVRLFAAGLLEYLAAHIACTHARIFCTCCLPCNRIVRALTSAPSTEPEIRNPLFSACVALHPYRAHTSAPSAM